MEPDRAEGRYNMRFLWLTCLVAAMGGLLFGYDWVVIGGAKAFYEPYFNISFDTFWQGFAMSTALVGCLFGALLSGVLTDRFGRKRLLIVSGCLFTCSAVWTALAPDFVTFNCARFVGGLGIGLASNLSPMYIAEISPAHIRGRFVSINQLTIVIGILAAQLTNLAIADAVVTPDQLRLLLNEDSAARLISRDPELDFEQVRAAALARLDPKAFAAVQEKFAALEYVVPQSEAEMESKAKEDQELMDTYLRPTWNGQTGWRWMFGAETLPAFLFFLLMFLVPESPRWLVKYRRDEQARRILARIGGQDHAEVELADIKATIADEELATVNYRDLLEPRLRKIVLLGVFLAVLQQWCGINVIFNYAQEVFKAAGYEVGDLMFSIAITGFVNLVFTFVAIYTVDRLGRKPLMLFGAAGLAGIYAVLGTGYFLKSTGVHMLVLVVTAIGCYAMSLAPITWVVISEVFPNRIRGAAMSVAVTSLWIACTVLTFGFPTFNKALGAHGSFWTFAVICVLGFLVIRGKLPETKGKTLEAIERELVD